MEVSAPAGALANVAFFDVTHLNARRCFVLSKENDIVYSRSFTNA